MEFSSLRFRPNLLAFVCLAVLGANSAAQVPTPPGPPASTTPAAGKAGAQGGDSTSAPEQPTALSPLAPAVAPPKVFDRPRIGVALGGGGALGLMEVGFLQWLEDHHIPVDVIAGTSMGCLVSSFYASGRSPKSIGDVVNDRVFSSVFSLSTSYKSRSFRRREDSRELSNGITVGLKNGVNFRNAVLIDQGLNAFLAREFLRYDDRTDFNTLPIPLRCVATDLNDAAPVVFSRGSIPDAVRASVSIPGIFPPFEMNGHEYVDGMVLENLPTPVVHDMQADVVIAFSLPLGPVVKGELGSILGVFGRAFSVATEASEIQQRKLADVVIIPNIDGYTVTDYLKSTELAKRGYEAADKQRDMLLKYAVSDAQWNAYLAHRTSLVRGPAAPVLRVRITAPDQSTTLAVQRLFGPLVNQPVDTTKIEALLDQVRADGSLDANYTVGYETAKQSPDQTRPIVLVDVTRRKTGPPFVVVGANLEAQTNAFTRATVEGILLNQGLGGFGSELRSRVVLGYRTELATEYFRPLNPLSPERTVFLSPHADFQRTPYPIFNSTRTQLADRQFQQFDLGGDIGLTNQRTQQLRAGYDFAQLHWDTTSGSDGQPDFSGQSQRARLRYDFDNQDRDLVPQYGLHLSAEAAYLFSAVNSENAPELLGQASFAHRFGIRKVSADTPDAKRAKEVFVLAGEGGTYFDRNVAQPFRFTLGGPLRLSASAIDEYRGTDYWLVEPALLRRIAQLPQPLGESIYLGFGMEASQVYAPGVPAISRQDAYFGVVAETPLGVITLAPAIGSNGERKLVFTLGKLF